ncbi:hypothetical protein N7478_008208 [Penicillium angulare]|uniref:uncharacterized protein n=1 Tax=Penicillium angulare TaxID=116970 RepID=UPI002541CDCE|nr:uncharacterized protein N7478_008208 [Penicillium angulare]KAJ5273083.1 hypothetical protein N7478_008208 [Penicillium angulare]
MVDLAKPYFGLRGAWLTFWITLACGADMTLYGYDQGVFSGVVISQDFLRLHDLQGPSKTTLLGTVTAIYDIGCFLGSLFASWLGERLGRRNTVLVGTTVMSIGALLQASSYSLGQIITGRIIAGIGNGMEAKVRYPLSPQSLFRHRWLISHDRSSEAVQIIADLEEKDINDPFVRLQMSEIEYSVEYEKTNSVSFSDILHGRAHEKAGTKTIRRLILGMGAQAMQQFSGINVTSYYLPTVLTTSVGLDESLARLLTACNSVQYLLFSLIGIPNVERWGRRMLMMFGAAGMCFCYIFITALIRYNEMPGYSHREEVASASVAFFFLYYIFFGIGMQGVPWLYPTEINSLTMRTKGAALGAATNWIFNFMVVEITPIGIQNLGWRFYIVWAVLNAAMVPTIYVFYPETAGRTLEDMDDYFRRNPPLFAFLDKEAISSKRPGRYEARDGHIMREKEEQGAVQYLENPGPMDA